VFIGHYAVGFAAKRAVPLVSLGTLLMAALFLDLLWPIFLLLALEHVRIDPGNTRFTPLDFYDYPITHSAVGALAWSAALAGLWYARARQRSAAWIIAAVVFSHWVLDFVTHRPDLPLLPGGPHVGLGLWNSVAGTLMVESALFICGVAIYVRATTPRDAVGRYALPAFVAVVVIAYLGAAFGPPPPSVEAIAWTGLAAWVFVPWGWWIDRHRSVRA
jgi:hypothetical protein